MIKQIRTSKATKIVASYLALMMVVEITAPMAAYALTEGPSQPEFNSFTPIGTSDMVDLTSGDFNYNIPVMDVGGYPLNLAYNSGVSMDQEASWVGLGWNLNVGQINRDVRGIPDDFNGDEMQYENNLKPNKTVGMVFNINPQFAGLEALGIGLNAGLTAEYNNYEGVSFKPSYGFSFELANNVQVGMNLTTSATEGVSVSPTLSYSRRKESSSEKYDNALSNKTSIGLGYNSRQGLTNFNMSNSTNFSSKSANRDYKFSNSGSGDISFVNNVFTPSKRVGFNNTSLMFSFSVGTDFWSIDLEGGVTAYGSFQTIRDKDVMEKAFGYQNTHYASSNDVLDFNRENDRSVSKNTLSLSALNYTYDIYSMQGQGIGGTFRPFRGQVGYLFDQYVSDNGASESLGGEVEGATGFHVGFDYKHSPSSSHTGVWNTLATPYFKEQLTGNQPDYESVYFKATGEHRIDKEADLLHDKLGGYDPIALQIQGNALGKTAGNKFIKEHYNLNGNPYIVKTPITFNGKLKRKNREIRNQSIQKLTKSEVQKYGFNNKMIKLNPNAKPHHTAAMKVLNNDGSTYMYGETAYNTLKREATFATRGSGDCKAGRVTYNAGDNSTGNSAPVDNYFNRITTPEYAHTYLLSSILSTDYEDITGNGPTSDDLGSYTVFKYIQKDDEYKWRIPYGNREGSYNAGLNSHPQDQKGSYVYGKKELKYIQTIETKTHVAYFKLSERKDGLGVNGEDGGKNTAEKMYQLDKIYLFSKPEYEQFRAKLENTIVTDDPSHIQMAKFCTKIAHFEYNNTLCQGIDNTSSTAVGDKGKLTLKKVYFTYRGSNMGMYTPYVFNYESFNPQYHVKSYDLWGNYKPIAADAIKRLPNGEVDYLNGLPQEKASAANCNASSIITTPEFPFVQQDDKKLQDAFAAAWSLTSVDLPSGGRIELQYESDDYQYVQDRKAMRMLTITGAGRNIQPSSSAALNNNLLYKIDGNNDAEFLYFKLPKDFIQSTAFSNPASYDSSDFIKDFIGDQIEKPIYFNFMLNMSKAGGVDNGGGNEFDYVSGYFKIHPGAVANPHQHCKVFTLDGGTTYYASIHMQSANMEGGVNAGQQVNPISKAGWYFGRQNLNRLVYGLDMTPGEDIESIARALESSFRSMSELFQGPNGKLRNTHFVARRFIPQKSWIRLLNPTKSKLGGGARIKKLVMHDNWDKMLGMDGTNIEERYSNTYGQDYKYELQNNGGSSGVATYEPIGSKENPFVEPFYDNNERLVAPREMNYTEKPFGESFFPAPTVTYSRVEVKNILPGQRNVDGVVYQVKKHASGKVISNFYTSKDFPTRATFSQIDKPQNYYSNEGDFLGEFLKSLVGAKIETQTELTLSQGFVVHTNDMNGKEKGQEIYNESGSLISKTENIYSTLESDQTILDNKLPTIKTDGELNPKETEIGVHYDVITDFRESYSNSQTFGVQGNVAGFVIGIFPIIIPMGVPERAEHTTTLHTTTTTKVINTTGILKEKIAYDLGSRVSTKNLAWDGKTGEVLLTQTINEYDDQYYTFNFPAYWKYEGMDMASENADLSGRFLSSSSNGYFKIEGLQTTNISKYLKLGDELLVYISDGTTRLWVVEYNSDKTGVKLMDRNGTIAMYVTDPYFKVYRSGYRNFQPLSMASITLMKNPLDLDSENKIRITNDDFTVTPASVERGLDVKIINANAIEYSNLWAIQCENNLPTYTIKRKPDGSLLYDNTLRFNPYVYNLLGDWRAVRSYAYLTGRRANTGDSSPRREGFFKEFEPYYMLDKDKWINNSNARWTFASQVTQFSPYGPELENKDALERFSAAQYGYYYKLPVAVGSNTRYAELGFDGFEDYSPYNGTNPHFAFSESLNDNVDISFTTSHTGRKSIAVQPKSKASFVRKIDGCKDTIIGQPVKHLKK